MFFCYRCFFYSFAARSTSELPRPTDRRENLPRYRHLAEFYNAGRKIWGQKHAKFGAILHNFRLWSRISPERLKISKIGKICDREQSRIFFRRLSVLGGGHWNFYTRYWPRLASAPLTTNRVGVPGENFKGEQLKLAENSTSARI